MFVNNDNNTNARKKNGSVYKKPPIQNEAHKNPVALNVNGNIMSAT